MSPTRHDTTRHDTAQHSTAQHNTTQHNTKPVVEGCRSKFSFLSSIVVVSEGNFSLSINQSIDRSIDRSIYIDRSRTGKRGIRLTVIGNERPTTGMAVQSMMLYCRPFLIYEYFNSLFFAYRNPLFGTTEYWYGVLLPNTTSYVHRYEDRRAALADRRKKKRENILTGDSEV